MLDADKRLCDSNGMKNKSDENWELHHCEMCGREVDGPSQLKTHDEWTRLCGVCYRSVTAKTTALTPDELIQRIWHTTEHGGKHAVGVVAAIRELITEWRHS